MIFIILGSQKFQFNRLLASVDQLIEKKVITEPVFAQRGYSDYLPKFFDYTEFMNQDEFNEMESRANLIITHGGTGSIISAVKKGKKVIAVPRLVRYGEHVDDHQKEIIRQFSDSNLILACMEIEDLEIKIKEAETMKFDVYVSGTQRYLDEIGNYIDHIVI